MLILAQPDNALWLVISVLVVWRLASLICFESGPFDSMSKMRGVLYRLKLGSVIGCFHCTALWISIFVTLVVYQPGAATLFLMFAVAGGASILERWLSPETILEEVNDVRS